MKIKINWDSLGIITSIACAIHCILLPLVFTSLPLFGADIIHNSIFEWSMISLAFFVGMYALLHGYKTHHKNSLPLILFSIGFLFLIAKQYWLNIETVLIIPAVIFIIAAHIKNFLLCRKSKCTSPHHTH